MQTADNWLEFCAAEMDRAGLFFGHGTDNAHDEAAWMLLHVLGKPIDGSFQQWDVILTEDQQAALRALLARRINERCPLAYLTGEARFCGLDFVVSPQVLIPRSPLAELIVEKFSPWLDLHEGARLLDMCTGGGCIAIAMAVYIPECNVDAVDISAEALNIAKQNIERHAVNDRVRLIRSDLFSALDKTAYDLIVSNPPYVSADVFEQLPAEYRAEPSLGLVSGEDGLDIVLKILDAAPGYLKQRGILVVEVGESAETLQEILPRVPFFWLDFDAGGDGIFMLEYDQLIACREDVRAILEQRKNV
ncbi:MAG TPA: 50S ribosomal protein L3 N(5)-glutamine methyltransferase [Xanthomonadales bacterium]